MEKSAGRLGLRSGGGTGGGEKGAVGGGTKGGGGSGRHRTGDRELGGAESAKANLNLNLIIYFTLSHSSVWITNKNMLDNFVQRRFLSQFSLFYCKSHITILLISLLSLFSANVLLFSDFSTFCHLLVTVSE